MTHTKYTEQISMWLDNELDPAKVEELQAHLTECSACSQFYQAMQQVNRVLQKAVMVEPSPGFTQRFETRLAQHQLKQGRMWLGMTILGITTVVLFVAAGIMGWMAFAAWNTSWILPTLYYYLGQLGEMVNETRAMVNLGALLLKATLMTMQEPMFWGFAAVALATIATWVRVMQVIYRRMPLSTAIFA
jgi:predicted anti-sigma-YlaC factor YlaD